MGLEAAYWVALGVGVAFLLLSILLGDLFDFLDFLDFGLGDGFAATPVFFTAIAAFGGGGLLALNIGGVSAGLSIIVGLGTAVALGGAAAAFFRILGKQEAGEGFSIGQLVGARGMCTVAIPPGSTGRISIHHQGMTRAIAATSSEQIRAGDEVEVVDVVGNTVKVKSAGS